MDGEVTCGWCLGYEWMYLPLFQILLNINRIQQLGLSTMRMCDWLFNALAAVCFQMPTNTVRVTSTGTACGITGSIARAGAAPMTSTVAATDEMVARGTAARSQLSWRAALARRRPRQRWPVRGASAVEMRLRPTCKLSRVIWLYCGANNISMR